MTFLWGSSVKTGNYLPRACWRRFSGTLWPESQCCAGLNDLSIFFFKNGQILSLGHQKVQNESDL